jgi:hypothetical protein
MSSVTARWCSSLMRLIVCLRNVSSLRFRIFLCKNGVRNMQENFGGSVVDGIATI